MIMIIIIIIIIKLSHPRLVCSADKKCTRLVSALPWGLLNLSNIEK